MFGFKQKGSLGYLGYSSLIHGTAVAVIATVSNFTPMQLGTQSTTVEFTVGSLPKGAQTEKLVANKSAKSPVVEKKKLLPKNSDVVVVKPVNKIKKAKDNKNKLLAAKVALDLKKKNAKLKKTSQKKTKAQAQLKKLKEAKKQKQLKKIAKAKELKKQQALKQHELAKLQEQRKLEKLKELEELKAQEKLRQQDLAEQEELRQQQLAEAQELKQQAKDEELKKQQALLRAQQLADLPQKSTKGYGADSPQASFNLRQVPGNVLPRYPEVARRRGAKGSGELMYYVTNSGRVTKLRLVKSTGNRSLDDSALRAISKFRYVPGQAGWTKHPFAFDLTGPASQTPSRLRR